MLRRHFVRALLPAAVLAVAAAPVLAAGALPFTEGGFVAAQRAGRPILVHIWASWCPTCARQAPTLARLEGDPAFRDLAVFDVNFDTQKAVVRAFGAQLQSTLIVFHGAKETGRAVGVTDPAATRALLANSLG
jgi:thioredoxin